MIPQIAVQIRQKLRTVRTSGSAIRPTPVRSLASGGKLVGEYREWHYQRHVGCRFLTILHDLASAFVRPEILGRVTVHVVPGVAGLVLTGGSSRRMGRDKASLPLGEATCAERVAARLSHVVTPTLEVGPGRSGLSTVREERPGAGPLSALASGWEALGKMGHRGPVVVLACDLPLISEPLLRLLAGHASSGSVVPVVDGRTQPLCARFSAAALEHGARSAAAGWRSLAPLLEHEDVVWLEEPAWTGVADRRTFTDVDTPADLARLGLDAS
jgi:molybdopterin-guanine dinucleotide biosynthesis protein A